MFGSTNTKLQGSGLSYGYIMAEYPKGSQCQVTRELDEKILKAKDTGGNWAFALPEVIGLKIPKEYQEVKWIGTTGTQYIDTGIFPTGNNSLIINIESNSNDQDRPVFGTLKQYWGMTSYNSAWTVEDNGTFYDNNGTYSPIIGTKYNIIFNNNSGGVIVNNNIIRNNLTFSPIANYSLLLSARRSSATAIDKYGAYRYKYVKLTNTITGNIVFELIPCYRKIDSVAGMYDVVSNTFFTNAGTGTFTIGPDAGGDKWTAYCTDGENEAENKVNILYNGDIKSTKLYYRVPKEYQAIEYLQNSTNAYYDTGIIPITTNYTTEVKFQVSETNGGYLLGVEGGYFIRKPDSYNQIYYGWDNSSTYFAVDGISTVGTNFDLIYNATGGQIILNGEVKATNANIKALSNRQYSILIGANRYGANVQNYGRWRYKEVIISERDTGNKLAELFPCYRKSDNVIGFWDTVGQKFLTHLGTGTVTAGPDI